MQGVDLDPKQSLAAGSHGRSLRQGSSFRSRRTTAQSGDGNESQQGVEDVDVCRVDCWNGGYLEVKGQSAVVREQQDWMEHNQQLLHGLQVSLLAAASRTNTMKDLAAAVCLSLIDLCQGYRETTPQISMDMRESQPMQHVIMPAWAARYNTWLLFTLTSKGVVFFFITPAVCSSLVRC